MSKRTDDHSLDYITEALRVYEPDGPQIGLGRTFVDWHRQAVRLQEAMHRRAAELNSRVNIAEPVKDMEGFWRLASETDAGTTNLTYWDTFENGRRLQLERVLADSYGSAESILVNCGMSAIAIAIGACKVKTATRMLIGRSRYFETSGLIERHLKPLGVDFLEVDVAEAGAVSKALSTFCPEVVLFETVANMPSVDPVSDIAAWAAGPSRPIFILDNSVQSVLTRWFGLLSFAHRVLVVESGTKYITNDAMCGVVYGTGELVAAARHYARDTGQLLQARALSYLDAPLLRLLPLRLATHSRNVRVFASHLLCERVPGLEITALDKFRNAGNAEVFESGVGSLLYLTFGDCEGPDYGRLLALWCQKARAHGAAVVPDVRAGFGWMKSSARVYETARLNRADAPSYLRLSVGLEDPEAVRASATCLADAAREIAFQRTPALEIEESEGL